MINDIPAAQGISDQFAPHEIVTGQHLNLKHIKAGCGDYIEASTDEIVINDMKGRTYGCISLGPSGNWQGSQVCFDLATGRFVLHRNIKFKLWFYLLKFSVHKNSTDNKSTKGVYLNNVSLEI